MSEPFVIREVLFPTDFSDASRPACATAVDLVRHFGARLHVLHVVPPVTDPTTAPAEVRALTAGLPAGPAGAPPPPPRRPPPPRSARSRPGSRRASRW